MTHTAAPVCPVCGQPLDYVPNGAGHVMHAHPGNAGCLFAFVVGKTTREDAFAQYRRAAADLQRRPL